MANETQRKVIFDWLIRSCFEPNQLGSTGGAIMLTTKDNGVKIDVRPFSVPIVEAGTETTLAATLSEQIVNEAEAHCEGSGGGKRQYIVQAYRDAVRKVIALRPFIVEVDKDEDAMIDEPAPTEGALLSQALRIINEQRGQISELHRAVIDMAKGYSQGMPKIVEAQASMLEVHQRQQFENFALMHANIVNREGREAEAFAKVQNAKDMAELKKMLIPHLIPLAMQALSNGVMPGMTGMPNMPMNGIPGMPGMPGIGSGDGSDSGGAS